MASRRIGENEKRKTKERQRAYFKQSTRSQTSMHIKKPFFFKNNLKSYT
jgi:hypothetical protein